MSRLKPGKRLAGCTILPAQNSAGPEIDTVVGKLDVPFRFWMTSAARAPQPVPPDVERTPLCIC